MLGQKINPSISLALLTAQTWHFIRQLHLTTPSTNRCSFCPRLNITLICLDPLPHKMTITDWRSVKFILLISFHQPYSSYQWGWWACLNITLYLLPVYLSPHCHILTLLTLLKHPFSLDFLKQWNVKDRKSAYNYMKILNKMEDMEGGVGKFVAHKLNFFFKKQNIYQFKIDIKRPIFL